MTSARVEVKLMGIQAQISPTQCPASESQRDLLRNYRETRRDLAALIKSELGGEGRTEAEKELFRCIGSFHKHYGKSNENRFNYLPKYFSNSWNSRDKRASELRDILLLIRMAENDEIAVELFLKKYKDRIYRFCSRQLHSEVDAEDVFWRWAESVYTNSTSFNGNSKVSTWAFGIARRKVIDKIRETLKDKERFIDLDSDCGKEEILRWNSLPDPRPDVEWEAVANEKREKINEAIKHLSYKQREVIHLYFNEELSYEEISQICDIPVGTVKSRLFEAKKCLKTILIELGIRNEDEEDEKE
jgi:RNA polymerase sigma-70 factor (ECF subfamily)